MIRADDKVISLSWGLEGYDQGAHGWYTLYYMNYYTQTGERITFDSLGSGFRDKALELVTAKAAEMQAKEFQGKMHRSEDVQKMTADLLYFVRGGGVGWYGRFECYLSGNLWAGHCRYG